MIDRKTITPEALALLAAIMRTCPATALNGGEHARKHLEMLCEKNTEVSGCELRAGVKKIEGCGCEGDLDVYSHLLLHVASDHVDREDVAWYFASQVHAAKIYESVRKDFSEEYALKIVYGHLLVPVNIIDVEKGIVIDHHFTSSCGVLKFPDAQFSNGDWVVVHYGFFVDKITREEAAYISQCNNKSGLFRKALEILGSKMDYGKMHYYPRSLRIVNEQ